MTPYSVPLVPSNFSIVEQFETSHNKAIILIWSLPLGEGSAGVVDYYLVTVSPALLPHGYYEVIVNTTLLNVTVMSNTTYTFTLSAINCAGASDISALIFSFGTYVCIR